ncbi:MAG: hypothetical protein ABIP29_09635, partial [Candidatus Eisenbacteria bacterium]
MTTRIDVATSITPLAGRTRTGWRASEARFLPRIPPRYGRTTFFGGAFIPSDLYYSDLDGNWNADGDSLFGEAYQEVSNPGDNVSLI